MRSSGSNCSGNVRKENEKMPTKEDIRKNVQYFASNILDNLDRVNVEAVVQIVVANNVDPKNQNEMRTMTNIQGDVTAVMYGLLELSKQVKDAINPDKSIEDFFNALTFLDSKVQEHVKIRMEENK